MNKFFSLGVITAIAAFGTSSLASPRSLQEARWCAQALLSADGAKAQIQQVSAPRHALGKGNITSDFVPYYIFNNVERTRFVLVSGSDLLSPIIGYGEGAFDAEEMPDNLRDWLQSVAESTALLEEYPDYAPSVAERQTAAIAPFMEQIQWSQNYPFNLRTPLVDGDNSPIGCVAAAAAQCVYHYRYPAQGTGLHTDANHTNLSVNFSASTYDYDLMFDKFQPTQTEDGNWSHNYTDAQMNEVAKLCYHCSIMSDTQFGANSSSTLLDMERGLIENLQYDPSAQIVMRRTHTYEEWNQLIQNELLNSRPVLLSGVSNNRTTGHCLVIDGMDTQGLYHVNWGWSGAYNGYYDVTQMRPKVENTELIPNGYCAEQLIIVQLAPKGKVKNAKYHSPLIAPDGVFTLEPGTIQLGNKISFSLTKVYNYSPSTFTGRFGLAFVPKGGSPFFQSADMSQVQIKSLYGGTINATVNLSSMLPNGDYQVYPALWSESGTFSGQCAIIYSNANQPSFASCTIANGKATFSSPSYATMLTVDGWNFEFEPLHSVVQQEISCTVTNHNPNTSLVGKFLLQLTSPQEESQLVESQEVLVLNSGESGTLTFRATFPTSGQWKSALYLFKQNIDVSYASDARLVSGTEKSFTVVANDTHIHPIIIIDKKPTLLYDLYGRKVKD